MMKKSEKTNIAASAKDDPRSANSESKTRPAKTQSKASNTRAGSKPHSRPTRRMAAVRPGTKSARILALLQRPGGASLVELKKATGWQNHSVRGFLSGVLKKKLGLRLSSTYRDGKRTYRVASR